MLLSLHSPRTSILNIMALLLTCSLLVTLLIGLTTAQMSAIGNTFQFDNEFGQPQSNNPSAAPATGTNPVNNVNAPVLSIPQAAGNTQTPNLGPPVQSNGNTENGNFGVPTTNNRVNPAQPIPTPFTSPTNTMNTQNQGINPAQNPMASSQPTGAIQSFGNTGTAPRQAISPDQRFLNQGMNQPWNRRQQPQAAGGRQMFSSFDPNNPVPFQPRQQPGGQVQRGTNGGFDFGSFGTAGNDQMTFQHNGLGTGEVDTVRFGTGPNQEPFRIDFSPQENAIQTGGMGQGMGQGAFGQPAMGQAGFGQPVGGPLPPFGAPQGPGGPPPLMGGLPIGGAQMGGMPGGMGGMPGGMGGMPGGMGFGDMMQPGGQGAMGLMGSPNSLFGGFGGGMGMGQPPPRGGGGFFGGLFGNLFG